MLVHDMILEFVFVEEGSALASGLIAPVPYADREPFPFGFTSHPVPSGLDEMLRAVFESNLNQVLRNPSVE